MPNYDIKLGSTNNGDFLSAYDNNVKGQVNVNLRVDSSKSIDIEMKHKNSNDWIPIKTLTKTFSGLGNNYNIKINLQTEILDSDTDYGYQLKDEFLYETLKFKFTNNFDYGGNSYSKSITLDCRILWDRAEIRIQLFSIWSGDDTDWNFPFFFEGDLELYFKYYRYSKYSRYYEDIPEEFIPSGEHLMHTTGINEIPQKKEIVLSNYNWNSGDLNRKYNILRNGYIEIQLWGEDAVAWAPDDHRTNFRVELSSLMNPTLGHIQLYMEPGSDAYSGNQDGIIWKTIQIENKNIKYPSWFRGVRITILDISVF